MKEILLGIFLILSSAIYSYEMKAGDLIKTGNQIYTLDDAGNPAIVIVLKTKLGDLGFESNNNPIKVDKKDFGYEVYLSSTERYLDINSRMHGTYRFLFHEHIKEGGIRKKESWQTELELVPEEVEITINSEPQGNIYLNGKNYGITNKLKVLEGDYSLKIVKDGYKSLLSDIVVEKSKKKYFQYELGAEFRLTKMPVVIKTTPQITEKIIDGQYMGIGETFKLELGKHKVLFVKDKYVALEKEIKITEDNYLFEDINLQEDKAYLKLNVKPHDALITLESINLLNTNEKIMREIEDKERIELFSGTYKVDINHKKYLPYTKEITIKFKEERNENIELQERVGNLEIFANIEDATFELIDKKTKKTVKKWKGNTEITNVLIGDYILEVSNPKYYKKKLEIEIIENNVSKEVVVLKLVEIIYFKNLGDIEVSKWNDLGEGFIDEEKAIVVYEKNGNYIFVISESKKYHVGKNHLKILENKQFRYKKYSNMQILLLVLVIFIFCLYIYLNFNYNEQGFNIFGRHKETKNKYDLNGYSKAGFDYLGFNVEGIHEKTKTKFNRDGYDVKGYNKIGYNKNGIDREGYDYLGFNGVGINKETKTKYDLNGYNKEGYNRRGFNSEGYNRHGYDKEGYNRRGFNSNGYHKITKTKYGLEGYNKEGYNRQGYDVSGYNKHGYDRYGYDRYGYDKNNRDRQGFDRTGKVYVTPTGKVYHKKRGCSGSSIALNLKKAQRNGYRPCSRCGR